MATALTAPEVPAPAERCVMCAGRGASCCDGRGTREAREAVIARLDAARIEKQSRTCVECGARFLPPYMSDTRICPACGDARDARERDSRRPRAPEGHDAETWRRLQWSAHAGATACCGDARIAGCYCRISTLCPTHGRRCWGSHD